MAPRKRKRVSPHKALLTANRSRYDAILAHQGGVCGICGRPPSPRRKLDMDHDHKLMFVRGLLCVRCNRALTYYLTTDWLRAAVRYLEDPPALVCE